MTGPFAHDLVVLTNIRGGQLGSEPPSLLRPTRMLSRDSVEVTETEIHNLFPTPLWVVDLEPEQYEPMNKAVMRDLCNMIGDRQPVELGSTLQTDTNLHEYDEFIDLADVISNSAEAVLDFLQIEYENFEITGCWANLNPTGGINTPHTHPNNYLSGVYYVQTSKGADSIFFADPRPQAKAETAYTGNEVVMDAKEGRLIIFPAWLSHGVPVNRSNRDRISVSFYIMLNISLSSINCFYNISR